MPLNAEQRTPAFISLKMQKLPIKKGWLILIAILLLFILLNPGYSAFKEFTGLSGNNAAYLHKKANYLIFSVYENADDEKEYAGVMMNFIEIPPKQEKPSIASAPVRVTQTTTPKMVDASYFEPSSDTVLLKNKYKKDNQREKEIITICGVDRIFLKAVSNEAIEAKTYINNRFLSGSSLDLSKYINSIDSIKKAVQTIKKIGETKDLDRDFLSYLALIEDFYKDVQNAYAAKDIERVHIIGQTLSDEIEPRFKRVMKDIGKLTGKYSHPDGEILFFNSDGLPVFKGSTQINK